MITGAGGASGATSLYVDLGGRTTLYAGLIRTQRGGAGDAAEVRTCDALVVSAPFGEAHHVFPKLTDVMDQTAGWAVSELAAERRPVLFCDSALDGLELAIALGARGVTVAAGRPIREAALRASGRAALPPIGAPGKEPRAVIWLDSDHGRCGLARRGGRHVGVRVGEPGRWQDRGQGSGRGHANRRSRDGAHRHLGVGVDRSFAGGSLAGSAGGRLDSRIGVGILGCRRCLRGGVKIPRCPAL